MPQRIVQLATLANFNEATIAQFIAKYGNPKVAASLAVSLTVNGILWFKVPAYRPISNVGRGYVIVSVRRRILLNLPLEWVDNSYAY